MVAGRVSKNLIGWVHSTKRGERQVNMGFKGFLGRAAVLGGALALSACVGAIDESTRNDPNFSIGYSDGCNTGNARVTGFRETVTRNDELFRSSRAYQAGWKEGYNACGGTDYSDPNVFDGEDRWYQQGTVGQ